MNNDKELLRSMSYMTRAQLLRKAEQHYEMAGLARRDGDDLDAGRHLKLAAAYDAKAKEIE